MGLNRAVQERLEELALDDPLVRRMHIKMSGCPNGCSQHHIADIGFYGASIKAGDKTIPAYVAHVGGRYEGGEVAMGQRLKVRLPAKRVPDAIERWLELYQERRTEGEEWRDFTARIGTAELEAAVKDLSMPVEFSLENLDLFVDWKGRQPFQVVRGEGECAV
jgi:sulfite reductase (ferredoxin)